MPDYILFACGLDELAQFYWHGCLFRYALPAHMGTAQYMDMHGDYQLPGTRQISLEMH